MSKTLAAIISFLICPIFSGISQERMSEVVIISTIHKAHELNPNYSYDSLFKFIEKYNPDIIGVEIRREDIDSSVAYLKNNYPFEMYESIKKYPTKEVLGFDWLGSDLEGKPIPENYWKEISSLKKLQAKLNQDSIISQKLSILKIIKEEKEKLILNSSLSELNDGRYDLINFIYYEQLRMLLNGSEYLTLSDFYLQRDEHIAENIIEIIKSNKGKRMIFLLGADHRDYTLKIVTREIGDHILMNHF